jgi:ribosomal-protein-alanine N-acetyltransferase
MTFTLRPADPADLDALLAIAAACPEAPQWPRSAYAPYLTPDLTNPALLRIALVAGCPTSPQLGTWDPPRSKEKIQERIPEAKAFAAATLLLDGTQNLAQLDTLAVHPTVRRHGLATALIRQLLAWATQNGARHFSLEVRASNAAALALYQRLGFQPEGCRPRYYTHPEEDALLLGTHVTAGTP